ncbi:proprotein convertase subtilisin/kexin type 1 inhibitor, like [Danio aesculapii]|uniref:proprotein convertase subtilisin/kexin type 1 inhibitor, like n=1 Tax=Danio aesculapii TaxID=1142201 RepID=UPI0024C046F1|nr:proprotein convertase subtilisin/kexin type 1 inhibitor, like [Danio aesculapii]
MSGLLSSSLLFFLSLTLFQIHTPEAKPLSAMHGGIRSYDVPVRLRRELRDSVPYEAQMISYPSADYKSRSNDLYYPPDVLRAQGLGQALQRLVESDQRREQEAAYLASMLRLLNEAQGTGQGRAGDQEEDGGDFQGPYPPDYDETEQAVSMAKPQASWQGLLDPQLTQALLNRYKQERLVQAGLATAANRIPDREQDKDQEMLRYLVEKILSSLASGGNQGSSSNPRAKRDLSAVSSIERPIKPALKRSRRSLDSAPGPQPEASLLRVKRLDDDDVDEDALAGQSNRTPHIGLQRMKRIDTDLPPPKKHSRKRRALSYDPALIAQHILQYLPG